MKFPAGIDEGFEIYLHNNKVRVLNNGVRMEYTQLPDSTRAIFIREFNYDRNLLMTLQRMGCESGEEMELRFVGCRYGAINGTPDLSGSETTADAPCCEHMPYCPGYGTVCLIPEKLSRKEFLVAGYIGRGKLDKEISHLLGITLPTVRTYIDRLHRKLNMNNRVEIALWAQNLGIV